MSPCARLILWVFVTGITIINPVFSQNYPPEGVVKIMPLGNSITQGATGEDKAPYRRYLWHLLHDNGYLDVDFVGSMQNVYSSSWSGYFQDYDWDHEGHWGWRADQILHGNAHPDNNSGSDKLSVWLQDHVPDVVLLHLGSNELIQHNSHDDLEALFDHTIQSIRAIIGELRTSNPDVFIFLSQLIPTKDPGVNRRITLFNERLARLAAGYDGQCPGVILVDQHRGFDPAGDLYDTYHPNARGAQKMAQKWYEKLKLYLDGELPGYEQVTPLFTQIAPLNQHSTAPVLPLTSENGITGTWSPAAIDTSAEGNFAFTFTPDANQCAEAVTMEVVVLPTHSLSLEVRPEGAATAGGEGLYPEGTDIMLSATALPGFEFLYWTQGGELVSQDESFTFRMPAGDVQLIAWLKSDDVAGTCAFSPGSWFAEPPVVWPFDLIVGQRGFTQEEAKAFWPADTPAKRAFTQYAAIFLSQADLTLLPGMLQAMHVVDHYFENTYPADPGHQVSEAAAFIEEWISGNPCGGHQMQATIFPNPFREKLTFRFTPASDANGVLELYNKHGKVIETLFNGPVWAGQPYEVEYVPKLQNSSMLFYRLTIGDQVSSGKVLYKR